MSIRNGHGILDSMKKIVIDAFGGDNSPHEIIKGAIEALKLEQDFSFVLVGFPDKIEKELKKYRYDASRIAIVPANSVISGEEIPTVAIKEKKDSSLAVCFEQLKHDTDAIALISAGTTGAVLAGGFLKIGRIKGVSRPALCPLINTHKGSLVLLIDSGANVDCKPVNLLHFAVMGSEFVKLETGVERPRVGLLSVGTEDHKGNDLVKQTFSLMKELDVNFVGNLEARDILSGDYDVVVCDGFAGNVALKSIEGAFKLMLHEIKKAAKSNLISKIGALLMIPKLKKEMKKYDFNAYPGSPFLGCKKLIMKPHGSCNWQSIVNTTHSILNLYEKNLNHHIEEAVAKVTISEQLQG